MRYAALVLIVGCSAADFQPAPPSHPTEKVDAATPIPSDPPSAVGSAIPFPGTNEGFWCFQGKKRMACYRGLELCKESRQQQNASNECEMRATAHCYTWQEPERHVILLYCYSSLSGCNAAKEYARQYAAEKDPNQRRVFTECALQSRSTLPDVDRAMSLMFD